MHESQRISLEGNFDRFFTTYAPEGFHRDALEVLTPDVMALLIDHAGDWDVELIDDVVYIVSPRHQAKHDRDEVSALLECYEAISSALERQTHVYSRSRATHPNSMQMPGEPSRRASLRWFAFDTGALASMALLVTGVIFFISTF